MNVRASVVIAATLLASGCVLPEVDLEGKECPCLDGFECDDVRNVCVPVGTNVTTRDGGVRDSGGATVDGGSNDGGRDAGFIPGRDAGPRDGGGAPRDAGARDAGTYPDCQVDVDCTLGQEICVNEICVPSCNNGGSTCTAPETCVDGRCIELGGTCAGSKECGDGPPWAVCVNGACEQGCGAVSGSCQGNRMCDIDGYCKVASRCMNDGNCGHPDFFCRDGTCVRRCDRPGAFSCNGVSTCGTDGRCEGGAPIGSACMDADDCDTGYCMNIATPTTDVYCSRPCAATADCPLDYTCASVSGAKQCVREQSFGNPGPMLDVPSGGMCTDMANSCQSQVCANMTCLERCSSDGDCRAFGTACVASQVNATFFLHLCRAETGFSTGQMCLNNDQCASGLCNRYRDECQVPCCSQADCGAQEICTVYDLVQNPPQPLTVCQASSMGAGTAAFGTPCANAPECRSELCAPVDPDDLGGPKVCTTYCCDDFDCDVLPGGGRCATFNGPLQGSQTKVCVPR